MSQQLQALAALTAELAHAPTLEAMLQTLVDRTAGLLSVSHASVRLLDEAGRLLVGARAGETLHESGNDLEFVRGEGLIGWVAGECKPLRVGDAEGDSRFVERSGMIERFASFLGVPLLDGGVCIGVLSAIHPERDHFTTEDEGLVGLLAGMCAPYLQIARLRRLAQIDPLTGSLNRRGLEESYPELPLPAPEPLSVAMVDIDHFKQVNDHHGHAVGDAVLRAVARILAGVLRKGDAVVRYGGEEFLMVLPGANLPEAATVAKRARRAVEGHAIILPDRTLHVTVSIGVAERGPGETREQVVRRADDAMYVAKQLGRNRVEVTE